MRKIPVVVLVLVKNLAAIIGISLVLLFAFFYLYLPSTTNHNETITVPDLVGMSFDDIDEFVTERNLRYEVLKDSGYSEKYEPLTILTQNPKANSKVKENRKIYISLNALIPPKIKMPNLINTNKTNAEDILASNGLKLGTIEYVENLAENAVLSQKINKRDITPGSMIPKGSIVDLTIGNGVGKQTFATPDLIGKTLDEVSFQIKASNLVLDEINYILIDSLPKGIIYKQLPPKGSRIRSGGLMEIWVNLERPTN